MKLGEFLRYKSPCPMCGGTTMPPSFLAKSSRVRFEDDRLEFVYVMKALKANQPDYEAAYSFALDENSFGIKLYSEWNHGYYAQMHLIEKFKAFNINAVLSHGYHPVFKRECLTCRRYSVITKPIHLNFKSATFEELDIAREQFIFAETVADGHRIIRMINHPHYSEIYWWRTPVLEFFVPNNSSHKILDSVIPFVSEEETQERLNKLLIFA